MEDGGIEPDDVLPAAEKSRIRETVSADSPAEVSTRLKPG